MEVSEEEIFSKKCTFSFVEYETFDEVNILAITVTENDHYNRASEVDVSHVIEVVEFEDSRFPQLPKDLFTRFVNLRSILCDDVKLSSLSKADFKMALNLEEFSCHTNNVKSLEKMLFNGNKKLQTVDLSVNEIDKIDGTTFFGLENLTKLLLNDNKLQNLSSDVFEDLISLKEINLGGNQLMALNSKLFENCKLLNQIYLNDNRIQQISNELLSTILEIQFLQLSNNELSSLNLNLSASALSADNNRLTSVNLNSVGYLSFFNNSLSDINLSHMEGVLSLNISTNKVTSESLKHFSEFSEIKSLDLSFNNLGTLNITTFLKMPQLQILNLQSTNLGEIGFGLFTHQTKLEQLDLSYNKLKTFELTRLRSMKSLSSLFIEGNNIMQIKHEKMKEILPALTILGFSDNSWACSYLSSLISYLEANKIEIYNLVVEKTKANVDGIACRDSEKVNEQMNYEDKSLSVNSIKHHQLLYQDNELEAISEKFQAILRHFNETNEKFVVKSELINELNMIKSAVASLKRDIKELRQKSENVTMREKNKETAMTQGRRDNVEALSAKILDMEQTIKELKTSTNKIQASPFNKVPNEATKANDDILTKLMIVVVFFIVCGFAIAFIFQLLTRKNRGKFMVRRAHSASESVNENFL